MALILPLCRLLLVAQNVWATYHVLKAPRISRATGQPSQRALAARKRAMKSCLAVWLVWACIWLAEGPLDSTVGIVMPFYSEAKSLATLGLLVFKSYAAEPIVLHLIRPAVKPYMGTIDGILELFSLVAGLVVNVLRMPWLAVRAWWNAPDPASASATSSSNSGSSSDDEYARRVALGDADNRAALHDAHRRAKAVFQQLDDAQRRHRAQSQSRERERPAPPTARHSRNSSSSSSVPPAPGAWSYTNGPRPSSRTSHYPPVRQPSATYAAAQQYPSRQPSATYTQQAAAPRPPSRTSHYASQPQPVAGPSNRRSSTGTGAPPNTNPNPYEIWYPPVPVPNRAPSPGSLRTQAFFYPQAAQQVSTPPPPYESVRQRTVPDTPHRFPGALPFPTPAPPPGPSFPVPQPSFPQWGFEDAPGDANPIAGGDGRPPPLALAQEARDFIDLTAEGSPPPPPPPPPIVEKGKEKALPSPPPDADEDEVMEIDSLPLPLPAPKTRTRAKSTRKRAHEPDPAGAAADEELSDSDTTSSSVVKKRRVAGGRVARRVAALDSVREQPQPATTTTTRKTKPTSASPPVAPKPARLKSTSTSTGAGSGKEKQQEKEKPAPAQKKSLLARVAPALAHQAAPPPAPVSLSASISTRTTRSSSRTVDATGVQGMAALDAAAAGTAKRGRSRR